MIAIAIFRRAAFGASKHTCDKQQRLDIMLTSENRAVTKINDSHAARHKELYLRGGVIFRLERVPKEVCLRILHIGVASYLNFGSGVCHGVLVLNIAVVDRKSDRIAQA